MNSIEAINVAINTLIAHRSRLQRHEALDEADQAIDTLTALREALADNERQTQAMTQRVDETTPYVAALCAFCGSADRVLAEWKRGEVTFSNLCIGCRRHVMRTTTP